MNKLFLTTGLAALMATAASAGTVTYDNGGSTLSCGAAVSCVQNGNLQVILGGTLTITYNPGSGTNVVTPSLINLGNLVTGGTGSALLASGVVLNINVNSTPPGAAGLIQSGNINGSISTNSSTAFITFSPNNTTTSFGTLPGIVIGGVVTYQVTQTSLGLVPPTDGNPIGQTTIQGAVTQAPEPGTMLLLSGGLIGIYFTRKRIS